MTDPRRQARILAMQALCQLDALGDEFLTQLDEFLCDESPPPAAVGHASRLVRETWSRREEIDLAVQTASRHWAPGRMMLVDRNVIRVAVCELLYHAGDVPPAAAINEAVEIARLFGSAESPAFVNGVLDEIRKTHNAPNETTV